MCRERHLGTYLIKQAVAEEPSSFSGCPEREAPTLRAVHTMTHPTEIPHDGSWVVGALGQVWRLCGR